MVALSADLSGPEALKALKDMFLIRRFEERCVELSIAGEFPGSNPVYIGQEATAVALRLTLQPGDLLFLTHRNHGHVLAHGGDVNRVMAEVFGKADGYCRGKGGTFHVLAAELDIPSASAIVGASAPLATGAALAFTRLNKAQVAVATLGDKALNEGSTWEALNLAALWRLPVLFLCEHNDAVPYDPRKSGQATERLTDLVRPYDMSVHEVDGTDLGNMQRVLARAVADIRQNRRPWFVEARMMHWPGDAYKINLGVVTGYTRLTDACEDSHPSDDKYAEWRANDPVLKTARLLVGHGYADRDVLASVQQSIELTVEAAIEFARDSPVPQPAAAFEDIYA